MCTEKLAQLLRGKRKTIMCISVFHLLLGLLGFVSGIVFLTCFSYKVENVIMGITVLLASFFGLVIGTSLLIGGSWAWWLTFIIEAMVLIVSVSNILVGDLWGLLGVLYSVAVFLILAKPDIRRYFGVEKKN
ncbi:hypothetical protein [Thermofilum sp.]|uniref:hypothetical protein n=1 Tax=Thermofilum sp. TaxID=1961369 RepID=UPI002590CBF1|nr:hypothetical protein [Thermofilum sp.]